jgi:hypothetical protein
MQFAPEGRMSVRLVLFRALITGYLQQKTEDFSAMSLPGFVNIHQMIQKLLGGGEFERTRSTRILRYHTSMSFYKIRKTGKGNKAKLSLCLPN